MQRGGRPRGSTTTSTRPATPGRRAATSRRCSSTPIPLSASPTRTWKNWRNGQLGLRLGDRDDVAVRVLEPRQTATVRRGPDAVLVLIEALVRLELDPAVSELGHRLAYVVHVPPEDRELRR